ncbi:SDR family oxidoreductase [Adhaeribacter pallidiroseus]|uniref:11-beta-hydroxysteroid dehydrogenase-like n=1 Tax=Adhaeribacter pallidiroseus TaxID=2072847 RepID=A0A369QGN5_9BACT|nr:SDR family oxidoreductase [Adhaeribacter pallidiroseus]RDC62427.1 11-beta-hydroxysteroid dehydrogenase-like [Adhaeribacter pallidiroseus]
MKTVLITGANKGIGFATAKQLAQLGYYVYLASRDKQKGNDAVSKLKDGGLLNVDAIEMDVTDLNSIKQAKSELELKIAVLDILINNAGISGEQPQNSSTCAIANLRQVFDTNYFGAVQTTQQFIPLLKKANLPVIVNVSSEVGSLTLHSSPARNSNWDFYHAYGSSKTALNAFTVMLAHEYRNTKFKINSVTPGYTATDLNQSRGTKSVEEGARPIVKLATMEHNGPTGKFFREEGEVPW